MSFRALHAAWLTPVGDASAQLVMFALAGHHNDETNQCNPSQATLARRTGLSVDTVGRACKRLVEDGYVRRHVNRDPATGFRYSDSYTLNFAAPRQLALLLTKQADEEEAAGLDRNLPGLPLAQAGTPKPIPQPAGTGQHGFASGQSPHGAEVTGNLTRKNPSGAKTPGATKAQVDEIWALVPEQRAKRGQPKLPDIRKRSESKVVVEVALSARIRDGHSFDRIRDGVRAYYADPDVSKVGPDGPFHYAKGVQRVIAKGLWETYVEAEEADDQDEGLFAPTRNDDGSVQIIGPVDYVADWQAESWLEDWLVNPATWRGERGPPPGKPGCRVRPAILMARGMVPDGQPDAPKEGADDAHARP